MQHWEDVGDEAVAAAVRANIVEWVSRNTDWHVYEDYTEMYDQDQRRAYPMPGSHRVAMYRPRGRIDVTVRPRTADGLLLLDRIHEARYAGWTVLDTARFELADPQCWALIGARLRRWARESVPNW